jgi:hypothetical protein
VVVSISRRFCSANRLQGIPVPMSAIPFRILTAGRSLAGGPGPSRKSWPDESADARCSWRRLPIPGLPRVTEGKLSHGGQAWRPRMPARSTAAAIRKSAQGQTKRRACCRQRQ